MNSLISPVNVSETKNATEGDKINAIMSPISHPMKLIHFPIPIVSGMELCKNLPVPIMPETHDICHLKAVTGLDGCSKPMIIPALQVTKINVLHLADLALWLRQDGYGIKIRLESIPKSIINATRSIRGVGINLFSFTCLLPTHGIIKNCMIVTVLGRIEVEPISVFSHVAAIKL